MAFVHAGKGQVGIRVGVSVAGKMLYRANNAAALQTGCHLQAVFNNGIGLASIRALTDYWIFGIGVNVHNRGKVYVYSAKTQLFCSKLANLKDFCRSFVI